MSTTAGPLPGELARLGESGQLLRGTRLQERHRRARQRGLTPGALFMVVRTPPAARAVDPWGSPVTTSTVTPPGADPEPSMPLYMRTDGWLSRRQQPRALAPAARPLRRRGDDDRRLARQIPRPFLELNLGGPRARGRPRDPAWRAGWTREDLDRAVPRADTGPVSPGAPPAPQDRPRRATGSPRRTTWRPRSSHTSVRRPAPHGQRGACPPTPSAAAGPPERHYAYGGYTDSFFIRSHRWAL